MNKDVYILAYYCSICSVYSSCARFLLLHRRLVSYFVRGSKCIFTKRTNRFGLIHRN